MTLQWESFNIEHYRTVLIFLTMKIHKYEIIMLFKIPDKQGTKHIYLQ